MENAQEDKSEKKIFFEIIFLNVWNIDLLIKKDKKNEKSVSFQIIN